MKKLLILFSFLCLRLHAADASAGALTVPGAATLQSTLALSSTLNTDGSILMNTVGTSLRVKTGTNARAGNATLVGGTVTVNNTTAGANTIIMLTRKTSGGTLGTAITYTISNGTSFTITSDSALDTSTFSYFMVELIP